MTPLALEIMNKRLKDDLSGMWSGNDPETCKNEFPDALHLLSDVHFFEASPVYNLAIESALSCS